MVQAGPWRDFRPEPNLYIQQSIGKGEIWIYSDLVKAIGLFGNEEKNTLVMVDRCLGRMFQYGIVAMPSVDPILSVLKAIDAKKEDPVLVRAMYCLVQLALGDGSAGTPLKLPPSKAALTLPKAIDHFGPELLCNSWADLADENSSFMRKQGSMRALAALAHASLTSRPDDATYVGGLFVTLQSLLDRIDSIRTERNKPTGLDQFAKPKDLNTKKNVIRDFRSRMEAWGLMRMAFSAARVALSKSGINKIAARSLPGVCSADPVGARHALALASLVARDPRAANMFIDEVGPLLANNLKTAKQTGLLFQSPKQGTAAPGTPPTISRPDQVSENSVNLRDPWARVYLARACAACIQSGHIAGDIQGKGAVFWDVLVLLACTDPVDLVCLEAIKAMFGAPYPKADAGALMNRRGGLMVDPDSEASVTRMYASSWHMLMSVADVMLQFPTQGGPAKAAVDAAESSALANFVGKKISTKPDTETEATAATTRSLSLFTHITARLWRGMQSNSCSLATASIKAFVVIAEARAWCAALSGGITGESDAVRKMVTKMQAFVSNVVTSNKAVGATERCAAAEALLWLQLSPVTQAMGQLSATQASDASPAWLHLSASQVIKCVAQGGFSTSQVIRTLSTDPWPEALSTSLVATAQRRLRCSVSLSEDMMNVCLAVCAGTPSHVPKEVLQHLLDAAPGPVGVKAAMELISSPLPMISQVASSAPVDVKLMACQEEAAYESLRCLAAWWLGEHINHVAGSSAWRLAGKAVDLPGSCGPRESDQRMAVASVAHAPMLALTITHLQRTLLSGSWHLKCAAVQALAKVAVRSHEPYRIQCYTALSATQEMGGGDAMGLGPVVLPLLEVLDAMYSGEVMIEQLLSEYGPEGASWPPDILDSVIRRHEWLLALVSQRVGFVPKELFCPLGPQSRLLLRPDEAPEVEEEEPELIQKEVHRLGGLPRSMVEAATAAAAAALVLKEEQYDGQDYDDQYYDEYGNPVDGGYDEYGNGYAGSQADPLAQWQEGGYDGSLVPNIAVQWNGGATEDDEGMDEQDARWGTVGFVFSGEAEDEVTVNVGERLKVLIDMGDWLHVLTQAGVRGLVPASYVTIGAAVYGADRYDSSSVASSSVAQSQQSQQHNGYNGYSQQQDSGGGYYGGYDPYGGYDAGQTAYYGATTTTVEEEPEASDKENGGGGFDDFGSILSRMPPVYKPPPPPSHQEATVPATAAATTAAAEPVTAASVSSFGDNAFGDNAFGSATAPTTAASASSGFGDNAFGDDAFGDNAFPPPAAAPAAAVVAAPAPAPALDATPTLSGSASGFGDNAFPSAKEEAAAPVFVGTATSGSETTAAGFGEDAFAPSPSVQEGAAPAAEEEQGTAQQSDEPEQVAGHVLYDFVAELESELSIYAGEELVVGSEVDGWYQVTRASDGMSGLVPAAYVQLS